MFLQSVLYNDSMNAQMSSSSSFGSPFYLIFWALYLVGAVFIFKKAGRQWWEAIIPIYNLYVLLLIVGKPVWWLVLLLIPLVNLVVIVMVLHALSKSFGYGGGFTLGLIFLPFIFMPILGLGDAKYQGAVAQSTPQAPQAQQPPVTPQV